MYLLVQFSKSLLCFCDQIQACITWRWAQKLANTFMDLFSPPPFFSWPSWYFSVSWGFNHPEIWGFIYPALLYNSNDYAHDSGQVVGAQREKKACSQDHPSFGEEGFPSLAFSMLWAFHVAAVTSRRLLPPSLSLLGLSLPTLMPTSELQATSRPVQEIPKVNPQPVWWYFEFLFYFPNWPATLLFKESLNSGSCILPRCYCCFTGR